MGNGEIKFMGNERGRRICATSVFAAALMLAMAFGFGAMTVPSAQAQTFHVMYNFGGASDGGDPYASLIRDGAGNLYSTFGYGGGPSFSGGVFKVAPNGT